MVSFNKVFIIGNLTRDPELRFTPTGIPVATLRLAINSQYRDKAGERKTETCYINVVVWNKQAELANQYLSKGRRILVEGRLQSRSWETSSGDKRSVIEIRADRIQFLDSQRPSDSGTSSRVAAYNEASSAETSVTFDDEYINAVDFEEAGPTEESDLPF